MADDPLNQAKQAGRTTLTEAESKTLLRSIGVPVPPFRVVDTVADAVTAARSIGFPVVVKVSSPAVAHKSDWQDGIGVSLDLDDAESVRSATSAIVDGLETSDLEGNILVESCLPTRRRIELLVGGARRPSFGPTVLLGVGGIAAEALDDVSHRLAPVRPGDARAMMAELRGQALLDGFRGRPSVDRGAVAEAIVAIGDLLVEYDEIAEVDVNPLLAGPNGVVALDALVILTPDRT